MLTFYHLDSSFEPTFAPTSKVSFRLDATLGANASFQLDHVDRSY